MRTKIVYVLISSEADIYLEQAYISMYSLKYYMPDAFVVLLTDRATSETCVGARKEKLKYVDELIIIDLDSSRYNGQKRSRILKTSVRNYVEGDILFIDTDTIVVSPFYDVDNIPYEIAACWDTHSPAKTSPFYFLTLQDGGKLGWPIEDEDVYYNSGVIYMKDTHQTREFYSLWNKILQEGWEKGVTMDQPSFAKTNYLMGHIVQSLGDEWNCELKYGLKYLRDAKIVHYLTTNRSANTCNQLFLLNELSIFEDMKNTDKIPDAVHACIVDPFSGLATVSQAFAGDDLFFLNSCLFSYCRTIFSSKFSKIIEFQIKVYLKIRRILCVR